MSYLNMNEEEIHDLVERSGLDDDMFFSLYRESVDRITKLEIVIEKYRSLALDILKNK